REPVLSAGLGRLGPERLERLRRAVVTARHDELMSLIEELRGEAPATADALLVLAERFDYAGLRALLASHGERSDGPEC
ncbi:MAG: hypothetical protein GYA57_20185, partial [Myxococcales bacterium]|nr:hypothetical protein [Myxococcales bacterium]